MVSWMDILTIISAWGGFSVVQEWFVGFEWNLVEFL